VTPDPRSPRTAITYPRRLHELAVEEPGAVALTVVEPGGGTTRLTRAELDARSAALARALAGEGIDAGSLVVLAVPNGVGFVTCAYATWWLGACLLPLPIRLVPAEQRAVLAAAAESGRPLVVVAAPGIEIDAASVGGRVLALTELQTRAATMRTDPPTTPTTDRVPDPGRALPSGGSTGRPKIIVDTRPMVAEPDVPNRLHELTGRLPGRTTLVAGPGYHSMPFNSLFGALFERGHVVLLTRFDAATALDAVERFGVHTFPTVPTYLLRMAQLPGFDERDLSSLAHLYHSGAACPAWLKRRWMDRIGPERVYEGFGSTEAVGMLVIRGDEWLAHPGSVGRGDTTEIVIRDPDGADLPAGGVGEIFLRWRRTTGPTGSSLQGATFRYWGSEVPATPDGFVSVGDLGHLDEAGYLYVADRRVDMIVSGGVNVYPAEVEAALSEHPDVEDVVVVGLPDPEWGHRVHAVVVPRANAHRDAMPAALESFARDRLSTAKLPKTVELVEELPRNEAGKVRRAALVDDRRPTTSPLPDPS
jgi:bile acid-coenzyme A ligase